MPRSCAGSTSCSPADRRRQPPCAHPSAGHDLSGVTLDGDALHLGVTRPGAPTLLAFLTSGCSTCQGFWEAFADPRTKLPAGVQLVVVTKDPSHESPVKLRELAPPAVRVVMSSAAWHDYDVPASPYFVHVDGNGELAGEGTAQRFEQVISLFSDAVTDAAARAERRIERCGPSGSSSPPVSGPTIRACTPPGRGQATMPAELYLGVPLAVVAGLRSLWSP